MSDDKKKDDEPIGEFDQTNGLAGNLEGDDGGAEDPEDRAYPGVLPNLIADPYDEFDQDEVDRGYSEEGRE